MRIARRKNNGGFTMVEMIVVTVIITIMAGLMVAGILTWQDWARFKKEDEYAQTLFVAAQNQLSEFSGNGRLEELQLSLAEDNSVLKLNVEALTPEEAEGYSLETVFPESVGKADPSKYQDDIVSLRVDSGVFDTYLANPGALKSSDPSAYWACELLGSYVYDTSILSTGAFVVEMTPANGQVFSVLYSDRNDHLFYKTLPRDTGDESDRISDISNRKESYREKRMVGYYGVDTLYAAISGSKASVASIGNVKLHNENTMYLTYDVSGSAVQALTYTIKLYDARNDITGPGNQVLSLELDGSKLRAGEANAQDIECALIRTSGDSVQTLGEFQILAYLENDSERLNRLSGGMARVHVLLDAADIQATTFLYGDEYEKLHSENSADAKFSKTYSFFRFGLDLNTGRINASVSAKADGYIPVGDIYNTFLNNNRILFSSKNAMYASGQKTAAGGGYKYEYKINNGRHLYNMRYLEDISYEIQASHMADVGASQITAVDYLLANDIDWADFQENGGLYDTYASARYVDLSSLNGAKGDSITRYNCDFPSIGQLRERDSLTGKHLVGTPYEIDGINASEISNALYDIYSKGTYSGRSLANIRPTGLFAVNYGTISDLNLDKVQMAGSDYVGAFCGINAGDIDSVVTKNTDDKSMMSGKKHVGGIMGFQMPTESDLVVDNLINYASVEGVEAVGGIVGMIRNDFTNENYDELAGISTTTKSNILNSNNLKITIQNCENYGPVQGVNTSNLKGVYLSSRASRSPRRSVPGANLDESRATEPRYIGGIVGYCYNKDKSSPEKIKIEKCVSSPEYSDAKLNSIMSSTGSLESNLLGAYVGGIAGFNYYGEINDCSTRPRGGRAGYLFGYRYVGGIVGFNVGPSNGFAGSETSKKGVNENHVIAYEYAGGIVGCNADVGTTDSTGASVGKMDPEKMTGIIVPNRETNLAVKLDNWTNKGVVIATNAYSGGITGYNAGYLYRCTSEVDAGSAESFFDTVIPGDYAGGIAGYNNGVMGNTERSASGGAGSSGSDISATVYVRGHNYIGGIVGYNDADAIVENYKVTGGYVLGTDGSTFVGGYAGLNASVDLIMEQRTKARLVCANPTEVTGDYCVGGCIGGNVINSASGKGGVPADITASFKSDNFPGKLEGKEFIGGFIGYSLIFDCSDTAGWVTSDKEGYMGATYLVTREISDAFESIDAIYSDVPSRLAEKKTVLDDLNGNLPISINASAKRMVITTSDATSAKPNYDCVKGQIYVGGVLGYNDDNTYLYINNIDNATPIIATEAIEYKDEQKGRATDYVGRDFTYLYSYAGGIIGKVSKNTTLDACSNTPSGTVDTKGTYTGGLCEINEGKIINCKIAVLGNKETDYIGGLCGLNKQTGLITECNFENSTVIGRNVVGGIASENFGTISKIKMTKPRMIVEGKEYSDGFTDGVAGLYAAFNGETGVLTLEQDLTNVDILSGGRFVGAVTGYNEGTVDNAKAGASAAANEANSESAVVIKGKIQGDQAVGGIIGRNNDKNKDHIVQYFLNLGSVMAPHGNAGGIIGENESNNTIRYCYNKGIVTASSSGNAGGITSTNAGIIYQCYDYNSVTAPNGMSGGITGINRQTGQIYECFVKSESEGKTLTFKSAIAVGGVAAQNDGLIYHNTLKNVLLTNPTGTIDTSIGVIAGQNLIHGIIRVKKDDLVYKCRAVAETNNCKVGGVSGTNDGLIEGIIEDGKRPVVNNSVELGAARYASLGGIVGENTGTVKNLSVDSKISGKNGTATTGYGGIAGFSGYPNKTELVAGQARHDGKGHPAEIINCTFDGTMHATGAAGLAARVGGIVGINSSGSKIEDCYLGVRDTNTEGVEEKITYITAGDITKDDVGPTSTDINSYAYIGGIAGENYGWVSACDNKKYSTEEVKFIGFSGETAGMIGYQHRYAKATGYVDAAGTVHKLTTSDLWSVDQRCTENDRGPGGIIGFCESAEDMSYLENYASVQSKYPTNNKAGGVVSVIDQTFAGKTQFYEVYNYGDVYGYSMAAGLVGRFRSAGAVFTNCENWGDIHADLRYAAGFTSYHSHSNVEQGFEFYHCANHGNISATHISTSEATCAGGFIGHVDSTPDKNTVDYFYDCVNTGTIRKAPDIGEAGENTAVDTGFASFVGSAFNYIYFEKCRNYNTLNLCANGFVGKGGAGVYYKDCFDDSNAITTSVSNSPFGGTVTSAANCYYLDENSASRFDHKDYGVYFNWCKYINNWDLTFNTIGDDGKNKGIVYKNMGDKSLYLSEPSVANRFTNIGGMRFNLTYADDSEGLDSFVIYFWNGDTNNIRSNSVKTNTVSATYFYSNGESQVVEAQTGKGIYEVNDETQVKIKNPRDDKKPIAIYLDFSEKASLRGFAYIPAEKTSVQAPCTYVGEYYKTTFSLNRVTKTMSGEVSEVKKFDWATNADTNYKYDNNIMQDVFEMEWNAPKTPYKSFGYSNVTPGEDDWLTMSFDVNNMSDSNQIESFVFYLDTANDTTARGKDNKDNKTTFYNYKVTFTDENGLQKEVKNGVDETTNESTALGYHSADDPDFSKSRQEVVVPDGMSKITNITLKIQAAYSRKLNENTETKRNDHYSESYIRFRGIYWTSKEHSGKELKLATGRDAHATQTASFNNSSKYIKLAVDYSPDRDSREETYVYVPYDYDNLGFYMSYANNDPISTTYYSDTLTRYIESKTGSLNQNSRIDTFLDIDPKVVKMMMDSYKLTKLEKPVLTLDRSEGHYRVSWNAVENAYAYEIEYIVRDASENVIYRSTPTIVGNSRRFYDIDVKDSWVGPGNKITALVKAVSAARMSEPYTTDYDSDYADVSATIEKRTLPIPKAHVEVIGDNRIVCVLDNYDDFVEGECTDCKITFKKSNGDTLMVIDDVSKGRYSKPYPADILGNGDVSFRFQAEPTPTSEGRFTSSPFTSNIVKVLVGTNLKKASQYCSGTYYNGFFGDNIDEMTYNITYKLNAKTGDAFVTSDIISYDDTVGATVSYANTTTHTANSTGQAEVRFTANLAGLPAEWFGPDPSEKIVVRSYINKSQNDFIWYGHTVKEGFKLSDNKDENIEFFKTITDDQYFLDSDTENIPSGQKVWDETNNDFLPGYILYKNASKGTYDLYYNATIELSMEFAKNSTGDKDITGFAVRYPYSDYARYAVSSVTYVHMKEAINSTQEVNTADYMESYYIRNMNADYTFSEGRYNRQVSNTNEAGTVQEIAPMPIIDEPIEGENDSHSHKTYTFTWDKFYQDSTCWNKDAANNRYNKNNDNNYLTAATTNGIVPSWDAYALKAHYDSVDKNNGKIKVMNAYYDFYNTATYRVEIIGITVEGDEIPIKTVVVGQEGKKDLGIYSNAEGEVKFKTIGGMDTTYHMYNYTYTFEDESDQLSDYVKLTARIARQSNMSSPKAYNYNSGNARSNGNGAIFVLPRYSTVDIVIKSRFDTITCAVNKQAGESADKLLYDVSWKGVTETEKVADLGGYLITAEVTDPDPQTHDVTKTHYYYVTDAPEGGEINLDKAALEKAGGIVTDVTESYNKNPDADNPEKRQVTLNLEDFAAGETVNISVKAIAKKSATTYTDSLEGVAQKIVIPGRLSVPDAGKLSYSGMDEYAEDSGIYSDLYRQGYTLEYAISDPNYQDMDNAKLEIAIAVFDNKDDSHEKDRIKTGDAPVDDTTSDYWNSGALKTIKTKASPLDMGGINSGSQTILDIAASETNPGDFAGKWLKIALRATDTTAINSQWSDEDSAKATTNYVWIHIPKLLEDPETDSEGMMMSMSYSPSPETTPSGENPETPENPDGPETPVEPAEPITPETPVAPEVPDTPTGEGTPDSTEPQGDTT